MFDPEFTYDSLTPEEDNQVATGWQVLSGSDQMLFVSNGDPLLSGKSAPHYLPDFTFILRLNKIKHARRPGESHARQ